MKLISMKLPKRKKKGNTQVYSENEERWPYGLQISFEAEQLKNLPGLEKKSGR